MNVIKDDRAQSPAEIAAIVRRTTETSESVRASVAEIVEDVRARGDAALLEWMASAWISCGSRRTSWQRLSAARSLKKTSE